MWRLGEYRIEHAGKTWRVPRSARRYPAKHVEESLRMPQCAL
jgi:hypothetical protein